MSVYDDPELQPSGEFVKFDKVGDSIVGTITSVGIKRWDDGKVSLQYGLVTDDDEARILTAGQVRLEAKLRELRPEVGDKIKVTLTDVEKRAGGKTLKHFDVAVQPGVKPAAASAEVPF